MADVAAIVLATYPPTRCDSWCTYSFQCPDPWFHEATGCCADCEHWPDILDEHIERCAPRCLTRLSMSTRTTWAATRALRELPRVE